MKLRTRTNYAETSRIVMWQQKQIAFGLSISESIIEIENLPLTFKFSASIVECLDA